MTFELLQPGTRVRWVHANPDGWAGDGKGEIVAFEHKRVGFGDSNQPGALTKGPAYQIRLDGERPLTVWVGLLDVERLYEDAA